MSEEQDDMGVIVPLKIRVSHEDMERINAAVEKWREQGVPEHEIKKYRDGWCVRMAGERWTEE